MHILSLISSNPKRNELGWVGVGGVVFGEVFAGGAAFVDSLLEVFEFVVVVLLLEC